MQGGASLVVANVHVDPINWRERRFAGEGKALSGIIGELKARRDGATDADEPVGLLTHHLDHDAGLWKFLERLLPRDDASSGCPLDRCRARLSRRRCHARRTTRRCR